MDTLNLPNYIRRHEWNLYIYAVVYLPFIDLINSYYSCGVSLNDSFRASLSFFVDDLINLN